MPYIAIKAYPKDEDIKKKVADRINKVFLEEWGCKQEAISVSFEEIKPEVWDDEIRNGEIESKKDKMFILDGQKKYESKGMYEYEFWKLIDESIKKTDGSQQEQHDYLVKKLLDCPDIIEVFDDIRRELGGRFYEEPLCRKLWESYGGGSDDGFGDFIQGIIAQGKESYYEAIEHPSHAGAEEFESFAYISDDAYEYAAKNQEMFHDGMEEIYNIRDEVEMTFIPASVKRFARGAFGGRRRNLLVTFGGTKQQFEEIEGKEWLLMVNSNPYIYCSNGRIEQHGFQIYEPNMCAMQYYDRDAETAEIPDGVKMLAYELFESCKLKSVIIPASVVNIGRSTFSCCEALTDIQFKGTIEQWESIKKEKFWNESIPTKTVKCSDGEAEIE